MKRAIFFLTFLPILATCQKPPKFQNVFVGPVGSLQGYGITAGATFNTGINWTAQVRFDAFRPEVYTHSYYKGEQLVYYKPVALVSLGADLLYMPKDYSGYLARTYGIAGWSYGLFPQNAFVQAGGGINSKHFDVSLVYRLGFAHYQAVEGWHLRVIKPFSLIP